MPGHLLSKALDAWRRGDRRGAEEACQAAVAQRGDEPDAYRLLAEIQSASGRTAAAIDSCRRVAALAPRDAANFRRLAVLLSQNRDAVAAREMLERSLQIEPDNVRALNNLASLLTESGHASQAIPRLRRALELQPDYAVGLSNLGNAYCACGQWADAIGQYERALALQPALAPAHAGRGQALAAAGRGVEAIAAFREAAKLNPRDSRVYLQMGQVMLTLGFGETALSAFTAALELSPGDLAAQEGRVMSLLLLNRHQQAIPAIENLRRAAPWSRYLQGYLLYARLHCADWTDFDTESRDITERVRRGESADAPLSFINHNDSPADQLACARAFSRDRTAVRPEGAGSAAPRGLPAAGARLRVAYLSPDFCDHPVSQSIAGVIESHDRSRVEAFAFSAGPDDRSPLRRRMEAAFEHFEDVSALPDAAIAERVVERAIDIVVDLGGHTLWSRTSALASRPAPVQVSFLGFPGTLGTGFIDYVIGDLHVIPERDQGQYDEQVIYMPDSFLPCAPRDDSVVMPSREAAGLPASGIVFCCFNSHHKILPPVFAAWMRILAAVPDSVLWLRKADPLVRDNLAAAAAQAGVDPARLIFAARAPTLGEHLARVALADLFLDTYPYNAHTTAGDALRAGVPVLTRRGRTFASRVATSLVRTCGLGWMSVETCAEYERMAVELAQSPNGLAELKATLLQNWGASTLSDAVRFCRHLESAFSRIHERHMRGERPSALTVRAIVD